MTAARRRRGTLGTWQGRAFLSVGGAVYLGPAGDTTPHAHHALQVCVALDAPFRLRRGTGRWREYEAALVPADVPHQLDGGWSDLLLLYVEPEGLEGHPWLVGRGADVRTLEPSVASALQRSVRKLVASSPDARTLFSELLPGALPDAEPPATIDPRITRAIERLRASPVERTSLIDLARGVGLSASRFRHLFRREVGMSAQSYVVWLRIYAACTSLAQGASLSDAALEAGFSDAAHFTRTFRRTFGLAPSQVAGRLTLVGGLGHR